MRLISEVKGRLPVAPCVRVIYILQLRGFANTVAAPRMRIEYKIS